MFTTAGVTAFTIAEKPWASWGGTAAAVLSGTVCGVNTNTAIIAPASPLPTRRLSFAFIW